MDIKTKIYNEYDNIIHLNVDILLLIQGHIKQEINMPIKYALFT
jgi:hypothetical protein